MPLGHGSPANSPQEQRFSQEQSAPAGEQSAPAGEQSAPAQSGSPDWNPEFPHWNSAPERLEIGWGELHVWRFTLEAPADRLREYARSLSPDEREKAARMKYPRGTERTIAARGALRKILAAYLPETPRDFCFDYGAHGKPCLRHASPIEFNLSHSGEQGIVAVSREIVGADVEVRRAIRDAHSLSRRYFSEAEWKLLDSHSPANAILWEQFLQIWTRKESVIKAVGEGLSMPLRGFCVTPLDRPAVSIAAQGATGPSRWHICDVPCGGELHVAACVANAPPQAISLWDLDRLG